MSKQTLTDQKVELSSNKKSVSSLDLEWVGRVLANEQCHIIVVVMKMNIIASFTI